MRIYNEARARGLCHKQKDFADLLGMNQSTISQALTGNERYLTDSLVKRIKAWEKQVLVVPIQAPTIQQEPARPDIVIPAATMELYTSMAKSIDRLSAMVERLMPGASAYSGAYAPKNFQTDRK